MSKKEIDKLFQEKFENFADTPTEQVWNSIENSLDKKKKNRKVIPIWWKLGGIAAVLAIGLFIFNPLQDDLNSNQTISDIENTVEKNKAEEQRENQDQNDDNGKPENSQMANTSSEVDNVDPLVEDISEADQLVNSPNKDTKKSIEEHVANAYSQKKSTQVSEAQNTRANQESLEKAQNQEKKLLEFSDTSSEIAISANSSQESLEKDVVGSMDGENVTNSEIAQADVASKKSIYDEIATQDEEEQVAEIASKKWSVGPSVAPVYFNGMGEGSPVHSMFVPNTKSGNVNMSYGVAVSYGVSNKLSIKTGVHKVDFGYNTNNVEFSSSLNNSGGNQLSNIDFSNASRNIQVSSNVGNVQEFASDTKSNEFVAKSAIFDGAMAQQFQYLEVPVELNYKLLDKKFGIHLVGGFSSLFLIDNAITLSSGDLTTDIGTANNVNNVNFSTNVGFGLNYKFTKRIQFNVEPMFKYQLNTFSQTSGDFQPFTIGLYSGLNFRF